MKFKSLFSNTRVVKIFGAKDYMVVIAGDIESDSGNELNALTNPKLRENGYFGILRIVDPTSKVGIHIHPVYDGSWSFAVCPAEEDGKMPEWPIARAWGSVNSHSETLEIELPKSATLHVLPPVQSQPKTED